MGLLDRLDQLALEFLVFLVFLAGPVHRFLLYFQSDRLAPDLLLPYFLLLQSPLYFHSVHLQDLLLQSDRLDQEVLLMDLLSLLNLLFLSGRLAPDQSLLLLPYFHSVLVGLVSLELLVFLVNLLHPVPLALLEFLEIPLAR